MKEKKKSMQKKIKKGVVVATTNAREEKQGDAPPATPAEEYDDEQELDEALVRHQDVNWFLPFYNATMTKYKANIPHPIGFLTKGRGGQEGMLKRRQAKWGKEGVRQVFIKAAKSPFMNYRTKHRFLAKLNWMLRKDVFPLILQGNYDEPEPESIEPTEEERRRLEAERYKAREAERRAEARRIDEEEHERMAREREERARNCVSYEEYQRLKAEGLLNGT